MIEQSATVSSMGVDVSKLVLQESGLYAVGWCWPVPRRSLIVYILLGLPFLSHYPVRGFGLYAVGCCLDLPLCESLYGLVSLSVLAL